MTLPVIGYSMSSEQFAPSARSSQSTQTFEEELSELIERAEDEDVDLLRARDVETDNNEYKYMIEISRIQKS